MELGSFYTKEEKETEKVEEEEDDEAEEREEEVKEIKKRWDLLIENLYPQNILIRQLSLKQVCFYDEDQLFSPH